jgi:sigma-E factor negative regulatory protein RseC
MKPTVPETGRVIRIEGDTAFVMLQGGESCRGCGAGKIGLCRSSGNGSTLAARNTAHAQVGDLVSIGLARNTQIKAFLFAFVIPLACFVAGALIGYGAGKTFSLPFFDAALGFAFLLAGSWSSFRRLRVLDRDPHMLVRDILSDCVFETDIKTEEEKRFEGLSTHPLPEERMSSH